MSPFRFVDPAAGRTVTASRVARWRVGGLGPPRAARIAFAVGAVTLALDAAPAHASFLSQISSFGTPGGGAGQFTTPIGVAVYQTSGNVFVADAGNARVEKFDAKGNFLAAWGWGVKDGKAQSEVCTANCQAGIPGSGPGQFSSPTSIAVGASGSPSAGKVFVGDAGNAAVEKFDADGSFIASNNGSTAPQGGFSNLVGVAVDQSGNLWTADANTDNITEFDPTGKFLQQWNDTFGTTVAIAVDSTHNAVYLIRGAGTANRFTLTGTQGPTVIDGVGTGVALALDPQTGNLYVDHSSSVSIFDNTGLPIDSLTLATSSSQGLAFHSNGTGGKFGLRDLYVSDLSSDTVTIYGPPSAPGPPFVTAESASITGRTTATLNGTVVPAGLDTTCTFQFVDDANFMATGYSTATTVPCTPADLGSSFTYQAASAGATALATPNVVYHFHVIATNSAGSTTGADTTFTTPPGDWGPFTRCPVDDPAMLATTGTSSISLGGGGTGTIGFCLASNSTHGSITIGPLTTPTGNTNLQLGLVFDNSTGVFTAIQPPGGDIVADPVPILGGAVTATVESAGTPSNFNLFAGISLGQPIITLPIKIHLESQSIPLGPNCFIGSDQNPIVLNPANTDLSNAMAKIEQFDPGGTPDPNGPLATIVVTGAIQGDNTFAVPGATGCGANDSLDGTVDAVAGLPSPAGSNNLVLDDASSAVVLPVNGENGQAFASQWHIAFGP
jgi:hypothetical protein